MEPIINPWIVYVINMIDNFGPVIWIVFLGLAIVFMIYVIYLINVKENISTYESKYKINCALDNKSMINELKHQLEKYCS